jgi:hypothetical protein
MLYLAKWLFIPYVIVLFIAACLGKAQSDITFGKSLFEEYLVIMIFLILIDTQRILIKWYTT